MMRFVRVAGVGILVLLMSVAAFWLLHPTGGVVMKRVLERPGFLWRIRSEKSCEGCHLKIDRGMDKGWRASIHFRVNVGCADCHGGDHEAVFAEKGKVSAGVCGKCHEKEVTAFAQSGHADAELAVISDARFLAQSPAMQEDGCVGCHSIGARFPDGSVGGCNTCHPGHEFSSAMAREPEACQVCHGGPDHPVMEAYKTSVHGILYYRDRDPEKSPSCVTCHMPNGEHGHVANIGLGAVFTGAVLEDDYLPYLAMKRLSVETFEANRKEMLRLCAPCHSTRFSRENLERADAIKREADALVVEAYAIIKSLYDEGALDPMPADRAPNPIVGHALELGGQQVYENTSEIEQAFFRLFKFYHSTTYKGAYHNSPDYMHWEGIVRMKMEMDHIRSEAKKLRFLKK
ncbi:MAG: multiheme c-type cytochrome [bacterium]|nr:multiheme c-type cytochrome [bacterium]